MRVSRWIRPALVAGVTILLLAACGSSPQSNSGNSGSSGSSGSTTPTPAASGPVKEATATVGGKSETIFTNDAGMTLYYYTPDKDASVTCTGQCAAFWPPLAGGSGTPSIPGVTGTFGSDPNPAGGSVVTYNGWPLYTFSKDTAPGQTNGQGLDISGKPGGTGVWFVATPTLTSSASTGNGY
jgi:predicted lipoprotein with Yx(FWY)xxD motif